MRNRRILEHFGVSHKSIYINAQFKTFSKDIKNAIDSNEMVAIVGSAGAGKTELFKHVKLRLTRDQENCSLVFVRVHNKLKEKMTIASVINAIIEGLQSGEEPRRDLEARSKQVIRLLGEAVVSQHRKVCVFIEEAHRLHASIFRALKELREDDFAGISPLFSVVLLGHAPLKEKINQRKEVCWRSSMLELNESSGWMGYGERVKYLKHVYGNAITPVARERLAALFKVPLSLDYNVEKLMGDAMKAGFNRLSEDSVSLTPAEILNAMNMGLSNKDPKYVSLQDVATEAGVGRATAHSVINGVPSTKSENVNQAIKRLHAKRGTEEIKQAVNS